jgi:hypothetical protein
MQLNKMGICKLLTAVIFAIGLAACRTSQAAVAAAVHAGTERPDGKAAMFYDALAPHGDWLRHERYGWVWSPRVSYGWRPYTEGTWVYTDLGWSFQCDLDWGWAPFHYGRWAYETNYGWVWVPDDVWAPAWVAWQSGDPWCGWAPLPPLVAWEYEPAWDVIIPPFCWSFVDVQFLTVRNVHEHVIPVARNVTLLQETKNVTKFVVNNEKQVVSSGIDPARVERAVGHPITRLHVENLTTLSSKSATTIQKDKLMAYRPDLAKEPRPAAPAMARGDARPTAPAAAAAPTPTGPTLSREFLQRQEAERRQLAEQQAAEAARLEEIHQRELEQPPRGMSLPNLAQRHFEEHRAFNEDIARQNQLFEHRAQQGSGMHSPGRR